ncbi:hypothetical protein [Mycobacterium shinjukuense]|uniref:hypothetical protein n=1 Tax=Mycobacterium shinjukuense TaxID=398694 RepID=UPI001E2A070A|nr:hypothetical protein [Mycobacterium shinjukuense]
MQAAIDYTKKSALAAWANCDARGCSTAAALLRADHDELSRLALSAPAGSDDHGVRAAGAGADPRAARRAGRGTAGGVGVTRIARPPAWPPPATHEYAADPASAVLERYRQVRDLTEGVILS